MSIHVAVSSITSFFITASNVPLDVCATALLLCQWTFRLLPCLGGGGGLLTKLRLTLVTPWTVTCQAPLSLGFSRQEYWGGLPVPSPGDLPNPGIKPRSPTLQADSLPSEPPGKSKNTRVGHLYLLQGIFSTRESNCRRILYQLSYKPRECLKKQRHHFANKGPYKRYSFSSSHVRMWELDHKEVLAPKNWCFGIVVPEKTAESPLDCKGIKPVHPKGNQSWIFTGRRTDAEAEAPWCWERLKARGEGSNRE